MQLFTQEISGVHCNYCHQSHGADGAIDWAASHIASNPSHAYDIEYTYQVSGFTPEGYLLCIGGVLMFCIVVALVLATTSKNTSAHPNGMISSNGTMWKTTTGSSVGVDNVSNQALVTITILLPNDILKYGKFTYFGLKLDGKDSPGIYHQSDRVDLQLTPGAHELEIRQSSYNYRKSFSIDAQEGRVYTFFVSNNDFELNSDLPL